MTYTLSSFSRMRYRVHPRLLLQAEEKVRARDNSGNRCTMDYMRCYALYASWISSTLLQGTYETAGLIKQSVVWSNVLMPVHTIAVHVLNWQFRTGSSSTAVAVVYSMRNIAREDLFLLFSACFEQFSSISYPRRFCVSDKCMYWNLCVVLSNAIFNILSRDLISCYSIKYSVKAFENET